AWDYFKKACEVGSTRTCQTIAKSALKRDDTSEAIFAYSHLCEKDIPGSCATLIELRRLKSENDGRRAQLELMQRQAESTRALQMQQLEATMATQRMEAMRTMLQGFQRAFQPVPVAPIAPSSGSNSPLVAHPEGIFWVRLRPNAGMGFSSLSGHLRHTFQQHS
ncbi:hypothetical protein EBZ37_13115, partial [bacterium]|nr:hypothetical protein [bacterium]